MARAKKETALTPEERLQAALVPDWEWPYKLPKNWCWTTVGTICDGFQYGYTEKATFEKIGPHFIRITDIGDGIINDSGAPYCKIDSDSFIKYKINKDDILIARMGSVGENGLATHNIDGVFASYLIRIVPRSNAKYVCNFLQTNLYWGQISEKAQGTTRLNVNANVLKNLIIPLPPLAEQQRIVDRIESLFAKLDEAKEKAQAVVDSFETRKAAILHKAFTGELTAKWRRTHGLSLDTWKEVAADSLFEYVTSGSRGWAKYYDESGAVFIRMGNLDHGTIELDFSDIQHVKLPNKAEGQRSRIRKNDILISITADVGMVGLVRNDDFEAYINQHIALARPVMSESAEFIAWYLVSDIGLKQMQEKQRGATKVGLSLNDIRALQLKIPLIEEQNEILKVIKMWIGKEHQAKEAAEVVIDQIDLMKKSILARAFRGELGTNDPSEESAVELLKQLI